MLAICYKFYTTCNSPNEPRCSPMTVGQNIRALRKKRGLSQEQPGRLCGTRGAAISGYERGDALPKKRY